MKKNQSQNKICCIVGMAGAGKTIAADELVKRGFAYLRFGQIVLDEIKKKGMVPNEKSERKIREELRRKYGMAAFAMLNFPKLNRLLKKSNVVVDGLYSWSEYKFLKEKYKETMNVIAVYAPPKVRYARLLNRTAKNDKALRFRSFTKEEAKERDWSEIENLEKGGPIAMADFTIINIGTIAELKEKIKKVLAEIL